jgi:ATP-dependent Clp protease ATP-binding subunit ClpA
MFERYTESARRAIFFARYEASQFGSPAIETQHLLLGILRGDKSLLPGALPSADEVRKRVEGNNVPAEKISTTADLPLSHSCKRVLGYGAEEASTLNHPYIGSEHLLLGLMREQDTLAAQVLREFGVRVNLIRDEISKAPPGPDRPRPQMPAAPGTTFGPLGRNWSAAFRECPRIMLLARSEATQCGAPCIETTHVMLALAHEKELEGCFPAPVETLRDWAKQAAAPAREEVDSRSLAFSEPAQRVFIFASEEAARSGRPTGPRHVLLGLLQEANAATQILDAHGFNAAEVRARLTQPPPASDPKQGRDYV